MAGIYKRDYTVHCGSEILSMQVEFETNVPFEALLQVLHIALMHQNPQSQVSKRSLVVEYYWTFKLGKWFKLSSIHQLLSFNVLGFFPFNSYKKLPDYIDPPQPFNYENVVAFHTKDTTKKFHEMLPLLLNQGGEIWAVKGIFSERLYVPHSARCYYKWCNQLLGSDSGEMNLVLRGLSHPTLALYCSLQCALLDRKEILSFVQKATAKSFRFLLQRTEEDVRHLRLLRRISDDHSEVNNHSSASSLSLSPSPPPPSSSSSSSSSSSPFNFSAPELIWDLSNKHF